MSNELSEEQKQQIIGLCLRNALFREALLLNPEETLKEHGYPADPVVVKAIVSADKKLVRELAMHFEGRSAASGGAA